jgi:hypothetical protein
MRPIHLSTVVAGACLLVTAPASAKRTEWIYDKTYREERPSSIDVTVFAWPIGGRTRFGGAGWLTFSLLDKGLLPVNDSLYFEGGLFATVYREAHDPPAANISYFAIAPAGGVRWNLHLTPDWDVFLTAKGGYRINLSSDGTNGVVLSFTIGGYWKISESMRLRLETGNYGLLQVGLSFPF